MQNKKKVYLLIGILLLVSNLITYQITTVRKTPQLPPARETVIEIADENSDFKTLFSIIDILSKEYLEEFDREELIEGAIEGLLNTLGDPQTSYLNTGAMENLLTSLKGSFGGIGVKITESTEGIIITDVIPDTPAEEAGLHAGDRICFVNEVNVVGYSIENAVTLIRGEEGSEVKIKVMRPGVEDLVEYVLERKDIVSQSVSGEWLEQGISYIKISQFDGTTGADFIKIFSEMEQEGIKGFILDLRDNPGGVLHEVLKVAREIVPEGEIVRIVDRNDNAKEIYHSYGDVKDYPIVVLINKGSASGSEIIAGALQDVGAALLVGEETYGKATVQHFETFPGGNGLRYTVAKYVTPSGKDIHGEGIKPDYEVEVPRYYRYYYYLAPGKIEKDTFGDAVLVLQNILAALKYDIKPTGYFDEATVTVLKKFQEKFNLEPHGNFDGVTWVYLRQELEKVIKEEDYQLQEAIRLINER